MTSKNVPEMQAGKCVEREIDLTGAPMGYNEPNMSADAIPNIENLLEKVIELYEFITSPQMISKKAKDPKNFEYTVFFKYREHMPTKIIDLLIEDPVENLGKLINMFEALSGIKAGKLDMTTEYNKFTENVNQEYLYPSFGGKEKFDEKMKALTSATKK